MFFTILCYVFGLFCLFVFAPATGTFHNILHLDNNAVKDPRSPVDGLWSQGWGMSPLETLPGLVAVPPCEPAHICGGLLGGASCRLKNKVFQILKRT